MDTRYDQINKTSSSPECCDWDGCNAQGTHPAPKSKHLQEHYSFCLEHVRQYNNDWDYFEGMPPEQIENYQKSAIHGHRPTWKSDINAGIHYKEKTGRIYQAYERLYGDQAYTTPSLPKTESKYLSLFSLSYPTSLKEIKKRYKALVKQHHPDINQNNPESEEQFKIISEAYRFLCNSDYFKA